jgi:hypothetical protein
MTKLSERLRDFAAYKENRTTGNVMSADELTEAAAALDAAENALEPFVQVRDEMQGSAPIFHPLGHDEAICPDILWQHFLRAAEALALLRKDA